ncbi:glycyl-radical enzyme activating protein [Synergistales bacterium]|nr:glycyl-radical enzyme activating protein [Synergistales bacterium]
MGAVKSGMVFDIKRYTLHDGPGIRVSVHMKGCPLSCAWCHNPESQDFTPRPLFRKDRCIGCGECVSACPHGAVAPVALGPATNTLLCSGEGRCADACPSGARELCGKNMTVDDVMREILKERMFFEQSGGGVTLTGGEPLCQCDFVLELLEACKRYELRTAIDTGGFVSAESLLATVPLTDLYLYDVKIMDPQKHREYTGADNEVILSNLARLGESGAAIYARLPFIPGVNGDDKNVASTADFLSGIKGVVQLNLLPYHTAARDKHSRWNMDFRLEDVLPPTEQALRAAARVAESRGVKTVIGG